MFSALAWAGNKEQVIVKNKMILSYLSTHLKKETVHFQIKVLLSPPIFYPNNFS
jgi:hypothetical protein